jgi:hypothetical protein
MRCGHRTLSLTCLRAPMQHSALQVHAMCMCVAPQGARTASAAAAAHASQCSCPAEVAQSGAPFVPPTRRLERRRCHAPTQQEEEEVWRVTRNLTWGWLLSWGKEVLTDIGSRTSAHAPYLIAKSSLVRRDFWVLKQFLYSIKISTRPTIIVKFEFWTFFYMRFRTACQNFLTHVGPFMYF